MPNNTQRYNDSTSPVESGETLHLIFERGAAIVSQGEQITGIYRLLTGRVALKKRGQDGRDHAAGTATAGDMIGMPEIMNGNCYESSAVAESAATVQFIPRGEFMEMVRRDPTLVFQAMKRVCQRISELEARTGVRV